MNSSERVIISSEVSSDEEEIDQDDIAKRCYVCEYCKSGFTTAQALGGHMNLHRKERAKEKQVMNITPNIPNKFRNDRSAHLPFATEFLNQSSPTMHYHHHYDMNFQYPSPPPQPPNNLVRNQFPAPARAFPRDEFHDPMSWNLNLSLQIGSSNNQVRRGNLIENDEVDLELRLGHHPY